MTRPLQDDSPERKLAGQRRDIEILKRRPIEVEAGSVPVITLHGYDTFPGGTSLIANDTWTRVADGTNRSWTPGNGFMSNGDSAFNWVVDLAQGEIRRNETALYTAIGSVVFDQSAGVTIGAMISISDNDRLFANYITQPAGSTDNSAFWRVTTVLHWVGNPFAVESPFQLWCYQNSGGATALGGEVSLTIFRHQLTADMELVE